MHRLFFVFSGLLFYPWSIWGQTPAQILAQAELASVQHSAYSELHIKAERTRYTREMELRSWNLGNAYSLVEITAPEREAGTVYMKSEASLRTYTPRTGKVIQLPSSMLMQGWMGTDAQFDQILGAASLSQDFNHTYLGKEMVNQQECHHIRCIPKASTPVAYEQVDAFVGVTQTGWVRLVFYDKNGRVTQQMDALHFGEFDGIRMPDEIKISTNGGGQTTFLTLKMWKKRPDLQPEDFTVARMKNLAEWN